MLLRSAPVQAAFDVWNADTPNPLAQLPPADAEATSELTDADIVEVEVTDLRAAIDKRRPRITRVRPPSYARAKEVLTGPPQTPRLPVPLPPPTRRTIPPVEPSCETISEATLPDRTCASSIAPFAIDLEVPSEPLPARASYESMADIERAAGLPQTPALQTALVVAMTAVLVTLSLVSALALRKPPQAVAIATPRAPVVLAAHEAVVVPAPTAPEKADLEIEEPPSGAIHTPPKPLQRASTSTSQRPVLGVLRLPPSVRGLLVDGAPHRVDRGVVSLPCGSHRIKTPSHPSRVVLVACAGTTML